MKRAQRLLAVLVLASAAGYQAFGDIVIKKVEFFDHQKCGNLVKVGQGGSSGKVTIVGDWVENLTSGTAGNGITVTLSEPRNGATNATGPRGEMVGTIKANFTATANAAPGERTVTLRDGAGATATMKIMVIGRARVTSVPKITPGGPVRDIDVTINGENFGDAANLEVALLNDLAHPVTGGSGQPASGISVTQSQFLSKNTTRIVVRLRLSEEIRKGTLRLRMTGDECSGIRLLDINRLEVLAEVEASVGAAAGLNYLAQIRFVPTNTFAVGSLAQIELVLQNPAKSGSGKPGGIASIGTQTAKEGGETVFYRLVPPGIFAQASPNQLYSANPTGGFNSVKVQPGDMSVFLTLSVIAAPSGAQPGIPSDVKIETRMHNKNTNAPPEAKDATFRVLRQQ